MTDTSSSAHEDLAFLRGLVDEDWRPGLWGFGAIYVAIGAVLIAHLAISASMDYGVLPLEGWSFWAAMAVLYSLFGLATVWINARAKHLFGTGGRPFGADPLKGSGVKGRAGMAALAGAFIAHMVLLVAFVVVAVRQQDGFVLQLIPLTLFALQGAMWFVVHAMRRQAWLQLEAWGWLAATLALAPLVDTVAYAPAIAVAAVVLMIVPGAYMMRAARKTA
jgi:hypothetical protein